MRIDKYLKLTRLIKRRSVAKVLIDEGNISINNKIAKPSSEVNIGDRITLKLGLRIIEIEVIECKDNTDKIESKSLYKIISQKITTK